MDALSGRKDFAVISDLNPNVAWITAAILVCLKRELKYLHDQNVAKSGLAAVWLPHVRNFNDGGSLRQDKKVAFSTMHTLLLRN